jgi:hypothetical protein
VTFAPTANGSRSGNLTLTGNSRPGTQTLSLSGWAGPPDSTINATPSSSSVTAGGSASYTLTLILGDGFTGTVQVTCTGAPSEATCTPSPASLALDAANTAIVKVTVSTTAASLAALSRFSTRRWTLSSKTSCYASGYLQSHAINKQWDFDSYYDGGPDSEVRNKTDMKLRRVQAVS